MTGLAWFLAGLGVYVRDIGQFVQFLLVLLLFISPVFYPLSSSTGWLAESALS